MDNSELKLISSDLQAREITLQVTRGEINSGNKYLKVIVDVAKPFPIKGEGVSVFVNQLDTENPNYWVIPTAEQIGNGRVFKLNSHLLNLTKSEEGYATFRDGVIDVNMHGGIEVKTVVGRKGESWIESTGLIDYLQKYDSVLVGSDSYLLLKDRSTNGGTVAYLSEPLKEDVTEVMFAERMNLKLYNDFRTKQAICKIATILTEKSYYRPGLDERQRACLKLLTNKQASSILFEQKSYLESNRLLVENASIINWLSL